MGRAGAVKRPRIAAEAQEVGQADSGQLVNQGKSLHPARVKSSGSHPLPGQYRRPGRKPDSKAYPANRTAQADDEIWAKAFHPPDSRTLDGREEWLPPSRDNSTRAAPGIERLQKPSAPATTSRRQAKSLQPPDQDNLSTPRERFWGTAKLGAQSDVPLAIYGIEPAREKDDEKEKRGDPPAEFYGARFWTRTEFLPNEFLIFELVIRQAAAIVAPRLLPPARVMIRSAFRTGHRTLRYILAAGRAFLRRGTSNQFSSGHRSQSLTWRLMLARATAVWLPVSIPLGATIRFSRERFQR